MKCRRVERVAEGEESRRGLRMPLKKKVKLVAANGSPIDVHGEKTIQFQINGGRSMCDELRRDGE